MSGISWPPSYGTKPASAYLDYAYSFANEIAENEPSDTISSVTVVPEPADGILVVSNVSQANGVVTFWLSAGAQGNTYAIVVTATMASGRILVSDPSPVVSII